MGYFYRFHKVEKNLVSEIQKCKTIFELNCFCNENNIGVCKDECLDGCNNDCKNCNRLDKTWCELYELGEEIFDFGNDDILDIVREVSTPLFEENCLNELYSHYGLRICDERSFLLAIKYYTEKIQKIYEDLLSEKSKNEFDTRTREERCYDHIKSMANEWVNDWYCPYQLDRGEAITCSCKYEYLIFELVRLYKTFDWENNKLIFLGW